MLSNRKIPSVVKTLIKTNEISPDIDDLLREIKSVKYSGRSHVVFNISFHRLAKSQIQKILTTLYASVRKCKGFEFEEPTYKINSEHFLSMVEIALMNAKSLCELTIIEQWEGRTFDLSLWSPELLMFKYKSGSIHDFDTKFVNERPITHLSRPCKLVLENVSTKYIALQSFLERASISALEVKNSTHNTTDTLLSVFNATLDSLEITLSCSFSRDFPSNGQPVQQWTNFEEKMFSTLTSNKYLTTFTYKLTDEDLYKLTHPAECLKTLFSENNSLKTISLSANFSAQDLKAMLSGLLENTTLTSVSIINTETFTTGSNKEAYDIMKQVFSLLKQNFTLTSLSLPFTPNSIDIEQIGIFYMCKRIPSVTSLSFCGKMLKNIKINTTVLAHMEHNRTQRNTTLFGMLLHTTRTYELKKRFSLDDVSFITNPPVFFGRKK